MVNAIRGMMLDMLHSRVQGEVALPGDAGYNPGRRAWNLQAQQQPAVVVMAESTADVREAVRFAAAEELGVGVMATGHGTGVPCDGGVLINTSRLRGFEIDPVARTARVEAGALWRDLLPQLRRHGLAGLLGSASSGSRWAAVWAGWGASMVSTLVASGRRRSSRPMVSCCG